MDDNKDKDKKPSEGKLKKPSRIHKTDKNTCLECLLEFKKSEMAAGKMICKGCNAARVAESRKRNKEAADDAGDFFDVTSALDFSSIVDISTGFETQDGLSEMLKNEFAEAIMDAKKQKLFEEKRLASASKKGKAVLIDQASKALHNARVKHSELVTKLMEKLQAMQDLRAKSEKAKPVSFYLVRLPDDDQLNVSESHVVPDKYWPDHEG